MKALLFLLTLYGSVCAQSYESIIFESAKVPKPSIGNMVAMLNASSVEWQQQMKSFDLNFDGIGENAYNYSRSFSDCWYALFKTANGKILIQWMCHNNMKYIMEDLQATVEKYYKGMDEHNNPYYTFWYDDKPYYLVLSRDWKKGELACLEMIEQK